MAHDISALEARIVELEIRYTHQEATVQTLSDVVRDQYALIETLQRALDALRDQIDAENDPLMIEPD